MGQYIHHVLFCTANGADVCHVDTRLITLFVLNIVEAYSYKRLGQLRLYICTGMGTGGRGGAVLSKQGQRLM